MMYQVLPAAGLAAIMTFCGFMVFQARQQSERQPAVPMEDARLLVESEEQSD